MANERQSLRCGPSLAVPGPLTKPRAPSEGQRCRSRGTSPGSKTYGALVRAKAAISKKSRFRWVQSAQQSMYRIAADARKDAYLPFNLCTAVISVFYLQIWPGQDDPRVGPPCGETRRRAICVRPQPGVCPRPSCPCQICRTLHYCKQGDQKARQSPLPCLSLSASIGVRRRPILSEVLRERVAPAEQETRGGRPRFAGRYSRIMTACSDFSPSGSVFTNGVKH